MSHRSRLRPTVRLRRGVMLFAVIVILAVAALAVGALMVAQEAEHAGQVASSDRTQQRANAWSGAQAVAAVLASQRERIAEGEAPELPAEMVLWEADGRTAVVRLLPVGPMGELVASELAKRALSTISAEELALSGVVGEATAAAVLAKRGGCSSIEGLVDQSAGLSPSLVLGPAVSTIADGVRTAQQGDRADGEGASRPLALADVLTTFDAQRALGDMEATGLSPRLALVGEWSSDSMDRIDQLTPPGMAQRMRDAMPDRVPAHEGELVAALAAAKVEPAQWSAVLNAVVCNVDALEVGRVDLGRAPEAVLRTLPGVGVEKAALLVQERQALTPAERMKLAWPVTRGVLTAEEFALLAPHITARSWLWKVRLVSGTVDQLVERDQLDGVQVWDVVVDLSEDPPRFASLRDSTLLPVAVGLAAQISADGAATREEEGGRPRALEEERAQDTEAAPAVSSSAQEDRGSLDASQSASQEVHSVDAPKAQPRVSALERARREREARQRAEEARRADLRAADDPRTAPSDELAEDFPPGDRASQTPVGGRSASDAPPARTSTGGLSGRWRTRGTH
ncbi:MAG: hypothetical protein JNK53_03475 [Phycisphaerae bacterium]|nr:hypothetical protein [Phycisphaerae bacterium]